MSGGMITVTGGIHVGASVVLSDGQDMAIGSGEEADLVLVDDGIVAHHASVRLSGDTLVLSAHHEGVSVFGHALAAGRTTVLRHGASFAIGDAQIQFSGRDLLPANAVRSAEFAWLFEHAPLAYVAKRWALASRGARLALACALTLALLALGATLIWQAYRAHDAAPATPKLDGPFRFVTVREDPKTHAAVYEGYVSSARDLVSLAALVRRDSCAPVMRVVVVDQMHEQLAEFLSRYYGGAQLKRGEPGTFSVVAPAEDAYLQPESWDYARVARLARETVNGLLGLDFEGHAAGDGPVRVPLRAIGMNLARSEDGAWLVDAQGQRYLPGAQLPLGKIAGISDCTATIVRDDDGTPYELLAAASGVGDDDARCS